MGTKITCIVLVALFYSPMSARAQNVIDADTAVQAELKLLCRQQSRLTEENQALQIERDALAAKVAQYVALYGDLNTETAAGTTQPISADASQSNMPVAPSQQIESRPKRVVFMLDNTGSMGTKFEIAKKQVIQGIVNLEEDQFFSVVSMTEGAISFPSKGVSKATEQSKADAIQFISQIMSMGPGGGIKCFERALASKGDLIWIVSDGDLQFSKDVMGDILKLTKRRAKISCLWVSNRDERGMTDESRKLLTAIATEHGGKCIGMNGESIVRLQPSIPPTFELPPRQPSLLD